MDTWIVLTIQEVRRHRRREVRVLKSRGMAHSNRVHEFELTDHGLRLLSDPDPDIRATGGG